jgi:DNA invertase Pin-like site-specific DNA recombinase
MRAAVYTRVSTPDQSTDRQRRELRNYAEARGWEIVREMQETASGASQKRPLREEVMQLARTRAVDVILVQALDRWGRSVQDPRRPLQALPIPPLSGSGGDASPRDGALSFFASYCNS